MNINIPPDSQEWLFGPRGDSDGASWSFRYPPPCEVGDDIVFRFDKKIVAVAKVHHIGKPGELDGWAHHGKRYLTGHKVVWLWESFVDLRGKHKAIEILEREQRERRRKKPTHPTLF